VVMKASFLTCWIGNLVCQAERFATLPRELAAVAVKLTKSGRRLHTHEWFHATLRQKLPYTVIATDVDRPQ
jgi:hypothetical protein